MTLTNQLEDLHLLQCSLLPGELLIFLDDIETWSSLLEACPDITDTLNISDARFQIQIDNAHVWFEVELPRLYPDIVPMVSIKGNIAKEEQERWQNIVKQKSQELGDSELVLTPSKLSVVPVDKIAADTQFTSFSLSIFCLWSMPSLTTSLLHRQILASLQVNLNPHHQSTTTHS
jgi:hypothetical protein